MSLLSSLSADCISSFQDDTIHDTTNEMKQHTSVTSNRNSRLIVHQGQYTHPLLNNRNLTWL